ncbi:MAG: Valine--tRNA ligase [Chlamydiae bacterium]|nr:Valine--tRNA ligase [Chlamydiota bacterium]
MDEIPTAYNPKEVEDKWYSFWKENRLFEADPQSKKEPFSLVMPPPNVTGILHMGHVLGTTIQDLIARYKRMQGYEVLWLPGTDHAGIATQAVVERDLIRRENKKRADVKRDHFEKLCWDWSTSHKDNIIKQIEKLGASCDFSRLKFTMDPSINRAVLSLFKKLYDEKLIYRGFYLVNWDPVTQTALADDEVEYEEKEDYLYYIKYPIVGSSKSLTIATTRPETLLGDTAIAISAKDERYTPYAGQKVILPLCSREIPILLDHYVDKDFGTGVVKITPAHDPNDYEVGKRHHLEMINIMTPDGKINDNGGKYEGLSMEEAREAIVAELKQEGYLVKVEPYTHRVGVSYRSKAIIQPYLSKQWFIRMTSFAEKLKKAVQSGDVKLHPKNWENTYFHWIDNLRDWCISRQLWWGHRIPIWYHKEDPDRIICHIDDGEPKEVTENPQDWRREEDVLDTWFSSALWPFSTLGWPEKTSDLHKFYPNSLLITGNDILFFWVARMLMMGEYSMNQLPFSDVILTGLIYGKSYWRQSKDGMINYVDPQERQEYDLGKTPPKEVHSKWEKISKSKGNAIDPKEIIDLYGTCAMRMALCSTSCQLRQIDLDRRRFEEYKNFTNKIWNGARFALIHLKETEGLKKGLDLESLRLEDRWILHKLSQAIQCVITSLDSFQFDQAAQKAYDFYWNEFCAYYLEIAKPYLFDKVGNGIEKHNKLVTLFVVLSSSLRLLHPMAPFITEELFQHLKSIMDKFPHNEHMETYASEALSAMRSKSCMTAPYPTDLKHENLFVSANDEFKFLQQIIYTVRNIRGEMKIAPSVKTDLYFEGPQTAFIQENLPMIQSLVPMKEAFFNIKCEAHFFSSGACDENHISIPLPKELIEQEKLRLEKESLKRQHNLEVLNKKLANPNFIERAPKELVDKQKELLKTQEEELKQIQDKLKKILNV